jgi:hypothetical protein
MLLVSEAYFFDEPASHRKEQKASDYFRRRVWEAFRRIDCDQGVLEILLPCSNRNERGSVRWNSHSVLRRAGHTVTVGH